MPPKSKAQNRLMQAAEHDPKVRKKTGVSKKVAGEFTKGLKKGSVKNLPEKTSKKG